MKLRGALVLLLLGGCAPRGPVQLSTSQLRSRASRVMPAAFDELYDATWLTLESLGWTVTDHDRHAGTFSTNIIATEHGPARGWTAAVAQEGASTLVTILPRVFEGEREVTDEASWTIEGPEGEQHRWDDLYLRIGSLVEAWRHHPELSLSNARGEVEAAGLRLLLPPTWAHFEFTADRRTLTVQRFKREGGLNPTLVFRIERRRPKPELKGLVHEGLERAFRSYGQVIEPDEWNTSSDSWGVCGEGDIQVGPGFVVQSVRWRRWEARSPQWAVRLAAACAAEGERACEPDIQRMVESAADSNGRLVNSGGAVPGFLSR